MSSDSVHALIARLENTASGLVAAPDIPALLSNFEGLPAIFSQLPNPLQDLRLSLPDKHRLQCSLRDCLVHLQRALIYAESRLQHEHEFLRTQIAELSNQLLWAERSRQSI